MLQVVINGGARATVHACLRLMHVSNAGAAGATARRRGEQPGVRGKRPDAGSSLWLRRAGAISFLQNQVSQLQMQLAITQGEILCIQMQHRDGNGNEENDYPKKISWLRHWLPPPLATCASLGWSV
uniref:Uncharacterized protein n=1 Tax=Oryza barthii TaxID=65489 RepID=A0A0D3EY98_9ORYZ